MSGQQEVRIFARLSDGSLRRAVRYKDQPGWQWVYEGASKQHLLGDIIVNFFADVLPESAAEFATFAAAHGLTVEL